MTLREYCQAERGRRVKLSEKALIAVETIDKYLRGEPATLRMALTIHKASDRQVAVETLVKPQDLALLEYFRGQ